MDDQKTDQPDNKAPKPAADNSHLEAVKQKAMDALVPIMGNIKDIDPQSKFDITLSAMHLTDNKALVDAALEAAMAIKEDNAKAEALVQLINEINYLEQA